MGLEYRFTRYFSIESTIGNTLDNGVDFVFTRDFDFFREEKKGKTQDQTPAPQDQPEKKSPDQ